MQPVRTSSGRTVKRRACTESEFDDFTVSLLSMNIVESVKLVDIQKYNILNTALVGCRY